jgi:Coenzyme PQQ synthesis protein D (PqqD)
MKSLQIAPSVRSVFSQDGAVLMEIKQGLMYTSNPVGGRILELLSQGKSADQVVESISRECEVEKETVRQDLEGFIQQLISYGIVNTEAA